MSKKRKLMLCYNGGGGVDFRVELPELTDDFTDERPTPEMVERAVEAVCGALSQRVEVFIDGEDKRPAVVHIEPWNLQDEHEWTIE